jgi:hypothetical protein
MFKTHRQLIIWVKYIKKSTCSNGDLQATSLNGMPFIGCPTGRYSNHLKDERILVIKLMLPNQHNQIFHLSGMLFFE